MAWLAGLFGIEWGKFSEGVVDPSKHKTFV